MNMLPTKGTLWSDKSGRVWKVLNAGRTTVEAIYKGVKRVWGLGTWVDQFEPFGAEEIDLMREVEE